MVCLITGASRGLGRQIALAFGKRGHRVVIHCRDKRGEAEEVSSQIGESLVRCADVRRFREVAYLVDDVIKAWGRIDVLVNNAGIAKEALLLKTSEKDFDELVETNLTGAFNFIRAAAPHMIEHEIQKGSERVPPHSPSKKGGKGYFDGKPRARHIINISSIAGIRGREGLSAYSASKAGLVGLTLTAARELCECNIMVNAVLPGYMLTDMGTGSGTGAREKARQDSLVKKLSDPGTVAEFLVYLAGTSGITGQVFNLDSRII